MKVSWNTIQVEQLFEDLEMKSLGNGMYAYLAEIDIEDSDSENLRRRTNPTLKMDDFIVPDDEIDGQVNTTI